MRVIISGKIRDNTDLFRAEVHQAGYKHGQYIVEEYYVGHLKVTDDPNGNFHLEINDLALGAPEQIPADMIVGFSKYDSLHGCQRQRGVYVLGNATAIVNGGMVQVTGTSLEDVRKLYLEIRAGNILPQPRDNWDKEQIKPSFWQRLSFAIRYVFSR